MGSDCKSLGYVLSVLLDVNLLNENEYLLR